MHYEAMNDARGRVPGRTLRPALARTAKRGGAVSAGALVVLLAGGSFALAEGGGTALPGTTSATQAVGGALDTTLSVPTPEPAPAPQAAGGALSGVTDPVSSTVSGTVGTVTSTVTDTVSGLTEQPAPPPQTPPGAGSGSGSGAGSGSGTDEPPAASGGSGAHQPAGKPVHSAQQPAQPVQRVRPNMPRDNGGVAARHRAGFADAVASTDQGQPAIVHVTPRLTPRGLDRRIIAIPGLDGRGVPGVLVVIATVGVAALGASHLGAWYNRRIAVSA
jgi:hypothetical protein